MKRPQRNARTPSKPPDAPKELQGEALARWQGVVGPLAARGSIDVALLSTYCQVWARWRQAEAGISRTGQLMNDGRGRPVASPLLAIANQAAAQVRALEDRLGISGPEAKAFASQPDGPLLTRRQLAAVLGVHMMTVTKWERDGLPVAKRGRRGKASLYREAQCRTWLAERESRASSGEALDLVQERARRERAQAQLAEQMYATREGKLLPAEDVEKAFTTLVVAVRAKLLAWKTTLSDRVYRAAVLEGLAGVERILDEAVREVLRELAEPSQAKRKAGTSKESAA